jgi:hypothetical protein
MFVGSPPARQADIQAIEIGDVVDDGVRRHHRLPG